MEKRELAPDAVEVRCVRDYVLRVRFSNGETRDFDVGQELLPRKCYTRLKNPEFFRKAQIGYGTVVWDDETDIDPEWLYEESVPVTNDITAE